MKKGFSLIELLVVMVIIGILAGIGIAQFKGQQAKAKLAKRASECSQAERCLLLAKTCNEGGGSNCDSICETASLSCKVELVDVSDPGGILETMTGSVSGSNGDIKTVSNWVRLKSPNPVLLAGEDGGIEFEIPKSGVNSMTVGFNTSSISGITWGVKFDGILNDSYSFNKWAYQGPYQYSPGDIFQIEREDGILIFRVNGDEVKRHTNPINSALYLSLDARFNGTTVAKFKVQKFSD